MLTEFTERALRGQPGNGSLDRPNSVALDEAGNVYIADTFNNAIKKWTATSKTVTELVNSGLNQPYGVAVDGAGNVYIADTGNNQIKKWTAANKSVSTLVSSKLNGPYGVAVDGAGNVYFSDNLNNAIKKWTAASKTVTTLVSSGLFNPAGVAVDGAGNVYIADSNSNALKKWTAAGKTVSTLISGINFPLGVALDGAGNVYIAETGNSQIKELARAFVDPTAIMEGPDAGSDVLESVLPDSQKLLPPFAPTSSESWLTLTGVSNGVVSFAFTANPGPERAAEITLLGRSIPITQAGKSKVALGTNNVAVGASAGSGSVALALSSPAAPWEARANDRWLHLSANNQSGVGSTNLVFTYDANLGPPRVGTLTISGQTLSVSQVGSNSLGTATLVEGPAKGTDSVVLAMFGSVSTWTATANDAWLHLNPANQSGKGSANVVFTFDANPGPTRTGTLSVAGLTLAVTQAGSAYVTANPLRSLVSGRLNSPLGVAVDSSGNVFIADTHNSAIKKWTVASGRVTTLVSAGLNEPSSVAVDQAGGVYIADTFNNAIKKWTAANQTVTTLVDGLNYPFGVAVDGAGNVYFFDSLGRGIKKWTAVSQAVTTLVSPVSGVDKGMAVDRAGNVYFVGIGIQKWTAASKTLTTLVASEFTFPSGVAVDGAGNVYIAETERHAIKRWTAASKSLTTLVASELTYPSGVAVDGAGNVYIADTGNHAIKVLPRALIDPTPMAVWAEAGSDVLPSVLPASQNLPSPFEPSSSQSWLSITGTGNGVVSLAFAANDTRVPRTAQIFVLGKSITLTQSGAAKPVLGRSVWLPDGAFQLNFTGTAGLSYSVLSSTDLAMPLGAWTVAGPAANTTGGQFQFTTPVLPGAAARFFLLNAP